MEKRVILFLIVSLVIIVGYEFVLRELGLAPQPPSAVEEGRPAPADKTSTPPADAGLRPMPAASSDTPAKLDAPSAQAADRPVPSVSGEQAVDVTTDLFHVRFTNRGAEIKSWELARYLTADPKKPKPIELVYQEAKFRGPLALHTADPALNAALREGLYHVERDFTQLDAAHPTGRLIFTFQSPDGALRVTKELTFHHNSYLVDIAVKAEGLSGPIDLGLGTNFGVTEWGEGFIGLIGPATWVDDKLEKDTPDTEVERKGAVRWVALQDKYFLSVLIPTGGAAALVKKEGDKLVSAGVRFAPAQAGVAQLSARLYAGPKEYDTLKVMNLGLEDTIDFGWFIFGSWSIVKAVAKPIFYVLRTINDLTHNFGVTIILLTVGIKLLFVPLQYKSYKSMKEMQLIQPKVVALQSKYKDDRERLNRELIKLYRDHKVNPVGGCLPMVLQMPVFVALFNILYMTIDLRQAPFLLWVTDLSVQDPYYVLPIIMGVSMVVQQKIMPTTMDPTQAKIMLLMPAFMTILFVTFPAGLVLYWLTNNVLTITQQFVTDRYVYKQPLFSSLTEPAPSGSDEDSQKPAGKRKKDKGSDQADADNQSSD
ncbi:MAG: membrane protein insertase YidC [Nitrospiraceae bacterium]